MDTLKHVKDLVKPEYDQLECWVHGWQHIEDVAENAKKLAELENSEINPCVIAAYCHDLGRIEEEQRKKRGDSPLPHALLSIEPTVRVLDETDVSGVDFDKIMEAVAVHSYKIYEGKNNVARILQDADKISCGFGPYRFLTCIKYFGGIDYVDPKEIVNNKNNPGKLREFCDASLKHLDNPDLEKVKRGIDMMSEWFDQDMFHTKAANTLIKKEEYEYLLGWKEYLTKKFNLPITFS